MIVSVSRAMRRKVAAILLVGLMFLLDSASSSPFLDNMCKKLVPCEGRDDEGWFKFGEGRCLKPFHTQSLTFNEAESACKSLTGHLVAVHSWEELDLVVCSMYKATPSRPPYWIGLYLSFHYEDNLIYDWTDGTLMDFSNFAPNQPDFLNGNEKCIETNYGAWGSWNDVPCEFTRPYVCQVKV